MTEKRSANVWNIFTAVNLVLQGQTSFAKAQNNFALSNSFNRCTNSVCSCVDAPLDLQNTSQIKTRLFEDLLSRAAGEPQHPHGAIHQLVGRVPSQTEESGMEILMKLQLLFCPLEANNELSHNVLTTHCLESDDVLMFTITALIKPSCSTEDIHQSAFKLVML